MDTFSSASLSRIEETEKTKLSRVISHGWLDAPCLQRTRGTSLYSWQLSREFGNYNVQQCIHVLNSCKKENETSACRKGTGRVHVHTHAFLNACKKGTERVRVWHATFPCNCLHARKILKNTRDELQNARVPGTRVLEV